jgi:hypothetical protein
VSPLLENRFCEICRQEMPLGRVQEKDFSTRQMALKSHFLSFARLKLQIQRGRKIVNLRVLLPLRYNILPLVKMKKGFGAYEKEIFQDVPRFWKLISCFCTQETMRFGGGRKSDF